MSSTSSDETPTKRIRRRRKNVNFVRNDVYSRHIYKIFKRTCPEMQISVAAMSVMNSFVEDLLQRIANEASTLAFHANQSTMSTNDIMSATKLVITTDELCKFAIENVYRTIDSD